MLECDHSKKLNGLSEAENIRKLDLLSPKVIDCATIVKYRNVLVY